MKSKTYNLLSVGVGGQGVISTIQILAWAALNSNYEVRTAEIHGMAQRGGTIVSFLRFRLELEGPLMPRGIADAILAFESSEVLRYLNHANKDTLFLINKEIIIPPCPKWLKN